jgi:hypothetical protein
VTADGVSLRLLGPVTAFNGTGAPLTLGGPRRRAVLAALLLERGDGVCRSSGWWSCYGRYSVHCAHSAHPVRTPLRRYSDSTTMSHRIVPPQGKRRSVRFRVRRPQWMKVVPARRGNDSRDETSLLEQDAV